MFSSQQQAVCSLDLVDAKHSLIDFEALYEISLLNNFQP